MEKEKEINYIDLIREEKNREMQLALLTEAYKKKESKERIREKLNWKRGEIRKMLNQYPEILYPDFPWATFIEHLYDSIFSDQNSQHTYKYKEFNTGQIIQLSEDQLIEKLYDMILKAKEEIESNEMKQLEILKIMDKDQYIMRNENILKEFDNMPPLCDKPLLNLEEDSKQYEKKFKEYKKGYVLQHNAINKLYDLIQEEIEKFDKLKKIQDKEGYIQSHIGKDRKKFSDPEEDAKFVELISLLNSININLVSKKKNLDDKGDLYTKLENATLLKILEEVFKGEKQKEIIDEIEKLKSGILKGKDDISVELKYIKDEMIEIIFDMLIKENDKDKELNKSYFTNLEMTNSRLKIKKEINENMK